MGTLAVWVVIPAGLMAATKPVLDRLVWSHVNQSKRIPAFEKVLEQCTRPGCHASLWALGRATRLISRVPL